MSTEWLKSVKVGDDVVRAHGFSRMRERIVRVVSVTPTIVCVDVGAPAPEEYRRDNGRLRGHHGYESVHIEEASPEARVRIRARTLADRLSMVKWDRLPLDVLEQAASLTQTSGDKS